MHDIGNRNAWLAADLTLGICNASQTEGESNPLKFSQMFHLAAQGSSFVITNGPPPSHSFSRVCMRMMASLHACKGMTQAV